MMTPAAKAKNDVRNEYELAKHLPYAYLLNEHTVETKNGNLMQVLQLEGLHAETLDDQVIDQEKNRLTNLLNSIASGSTSLYFHTVRKKAKFKLNAKYDQPFAQRLHDKWQAYLANKDFYLNTHYITIVKKPPAGKISGFMDIIRSLSHRLQKEERAKYRDSVLKDLNKIADTILTSLSRYNIKKLGMQAQQSELLSFLYSLINLEERPLKAPSADLSNYLVGKRTFFEKANGVIAFRDAAMQSQYAGIMSIKNYPGLTYAGMCDALLDLPLELKIGQVFSYLDKTPARSKIAEADRNLQQSDSGETSDKEKMQNVLDDIATGSAAAGEHTISVLVKADTIALLEQAITKVDTTLADRGIVAIREDAGIKPAFFAMLPGNHAYLYRKALVTSKNMAGFASQHNVYTGKFKGNHWGEAITILETVSGAPFAFNFHVLDVGNTFFIGSMGSGKTVVEGFCLIESLKFGGQLFVFDKDRGLETAVRALNGVYTAISPGESTGMAPFQVEDCPANRYALTTLMKLIAKSNQPQLSDEDELKIGSAVEGAFSLPKEKRILRNIVPFLGAKRPGSLRMRYENWVNDGDYAWAFDNETNAFDITNHIVGFDMTHIMDDALVSPPMYFYLFNMLGRRFTGAPARICISEGWKPMLIPEFRTQIQDWSSTNRKKNLILVLDTQSPEDIVKSQVGKKVVQESVTQIYFANPTAKYEDYVKHLELTVKEWQIIKNLDKESRYFLIKQNNISVVAKLNLAALPDELKIISNRTQYHEYLKTALKQHGNDAANWLEPYLKSIRTAKENKDNQS